MLAPVEIIISDPVWACSSRNGSFVISPEDILSLLNIDNKNKLVSNEINDIKDLFTADSNEITFFHSKKYIDAAKKTKASFCITNKVLKNE